ncbi:unnamed protein product [Echinostoma caproni]|uniref:ELKS/RAB6-interacting/CAST family member 2 n=1 Tax=Echinostoma caproni TaxID=27848 RepID=A0A183BG71_9TREM|nr:unnamed protein product [Echinostoma caproni]
MTVTRRMNMTKKDVDDEQRSSGHNTGESREVPLHSFSVHGSRVSESSRPSDKSKLSVSLIEMKERHLQDKMEQQMKELQESHSSKLLAVRQELETAKLAEEMEDKLSIRSILSEEGKDRVIQFVENHPVWDAREASDPFVPGQQGSVS